jgi:hypothetical protein
VVQELWPLTRRGDVVKVMVQAGHVSVIPAFVVVCAGTVTTPLVATVKVNVCGARVTTVVPVVVVQVSVPGPTVTVNVPFAATVPVQGSFEVQVDVALTPPDVHVAVEGPPVVPLQLPANGLPVVGVPPVLLDPPPLLELAAAAATPAMATPPMIAAVLSPPTVAVAASSARGGAGRGRS